MNQHGENIFYNQKYQFIFKQKVQAELRLLLARSCDAASYAPNPEKVRPLQRPRGFVF